MDKLARENSIRLNWSLLYTSVAQVKSCAENLLFLTSYIQGIPRVVRMLSLSSGGSVAFLKPFEIFLNTIKDTGSFVEAIEKVPSLFFGKVKKRESGCLYWGRRADAIAAGIEGFIMIPYRANLLHFGRFAGALGGVRIVKDSLALIAINCGFRAAGHRIRRNVTKINECERRLKILERLQFLMQKKVMTNEEVQEINRLKGEYQVRRKDPEAKMRILHAQLQKEKHLLERQRLDHKLSMMREKSFREKIWTQNYDPQEATRLQDVVSHKIVSRKMRKLRAEKRIELAKAERHHSVSISILIALGLVAQVGLYTTSSLLFLGQWVASLTTGILGFGKMAAALRYKSIAMAS